MTGRVIADYVIYDDQSNNKKVAESGHLKYDENMADVVFVPEYKVEGYESVYSTVSCINIKARSGRRTVLWMTDSEYVELDNAGYIKLVVELSEKGFSLISNELAWFARYNYIKMTMSSSEIDALDFNDLAYYTRQEPLWSLVFKAGGLGGESIYLDLHETRDPLGNHFLFALSHCGNNSEVEYREVSADSSNKLLQEARGQLLFDLYESGAHGLKDDVLNDFQSAFIEKIDKLPDLKEAVYDAGMESLVSLMEQRDFNARVENREGRQDDSFGL